MEKVNIKVLRYPYYHDIADEIVRKPKWSKAKDKHYVTYNGRIYELEQSGAAAHIWIHE